jgi:hypothetical protein
MERNLDMPDMKPDIEWKRLFLSIIFTLGGVISIFAASSKLDVSELSFLIVGITGIVLGYSFFWESLEGLREAKKAKQQIKDTKE